MAKTFSYDPSLITDGGVNQMRFELGDTMIDKEEETCALCDEEYQAIIGKSSEDGKGFGYAKFKCLEAIVMKLAYEVDYSSSGMSFSLSQRYPRWKALYDEEKKDRNQKHQYPTANPAALGDNRIDGGHYFRLGMNDNDRIPPNPYPFRSR